MTILCGWSAATALEGLVILDEASFCGPVRMVCAVFLQTHCNNYMLRAHTWHATACISHNHNHLETGVFLVAGSKVWSSLPATLRKPDIEFVTFKSISVWRNCSSLATFCLQCAVCKLTYSLTLTVRMWRAGLASFCRWMEKMVFPHVEKKPPRQK